MRISVATRECAARRFFSEYPYPLQKVPDEQRGCVNPHGLAFTVLLRGK